MGRTIDEEDAINAILREYNKDDSDYPTDYQQGLSAAKKIIEQLPSAQPEPSWDCEKCMMEHTDEMEKLEAELAIAKSKQPEPCEDAVSRQAAIDAVSRGCQEFRGIFAECEKNLNELPPAQPDRSLWFHICGTCVDESKGIISAEEAIKKIRELLIAADLILIEFPSPDTLQDKPKFYPENWREIL